eukprot:421657_1
MSQCRTQKIKEYLESYDELLFMLRKYPAPHAKRRCQYRESFMDQNAMKKACKEKMKILEITVIFEHEREYTILSPTGNIYWATIGCLNYCSCYRWTNKTIQCKHILHILHIELKIPKSSEYLFQNGFLASELQDIFGNSRVKVENNLNIDIVEKYNKFIQGNKLKMYVKRRAVQEDYCGICNNKFVEGENDITWCRGKCGENVHTKCFNSSNCSSCHARWVYGQDVKYPNLFKQGVSYKCNYLIHYKKTSTIVQGYNVRKI